MYGFTIPILMYHKVGTPVQSKADTFLNVSTRSFARQMRLLARLGRQGITLAEAVEGLFYHGPLPRRPFCITFDDAYRSVAENAAPVLEEVGWPATVFVATAYVGGENAWDEVNGKPLLPVMDWRRLRALQHMGWEIAGHTRSHARLEQLEDEAALEDMKNGQADLKDKLDCEARTFCYPYGSLNERTPVLAQRTGFIGACTTQSGLARSDSNPFLLPRVKIAYRDGIWGLMYRLYVRPRLK
jgi:peptidoglycan/xylan/chitin deacetylase (PgdA/CDA1 family)